MIFLSIYKQVYVGALVEKSKSANIGYMYSNIMLLLTIFFRASKKTQFAIFSICPSCMHTKQHAHLCSAAVHLQPHSEQEGVTVSQQNLRAVTCSCASVRESTAEQS